MKIIDRNIAMRSEKGTDQAICLFPDFCVLPSVRWIVTCRAGRNNNFNQKASVSYLDDEGKS